MLSMRHLTALSLLPAPKTIVHLPLRLLVERRLHHPDVKPQTASFELFSLARYVCRLQKGRCLFYRSDKTLNPALFHIIPTPRPETRLQHQLLLRRGCKSILSKWDDRAYIVDLSLPNCRWQWRLRVLYPNKIPDSMFNTFFIEK